MGSKIMDSFDRLEFYLRSMTLKHSPFEDFALTVVAEYWQQLREEKAFEQADKFRDFMLKMGIRLNASPHGAFWSPSPETLTKGKEECKDT